MFGPMNPMTERTRISNERQLNEARIESYNLPKQNRLAALMQKLAVRRPVLPRTVVPVAQRPATKRA